MFNYAPDRKKVAFMNIETFMVSTRDQLPPEGIPLSLLALWHAHKGQWKMAHDIAQSLDDSDGSWIHAHLHREEGDDWNAQYWYNRANKPPSTLPLHEERLQIIEELLAQIDS